MRLSQMRELYDAMSPFVSGGAYVDYCNTGLQSWAEAYRGLNLPRGRQVTFRPRRRASTRPKYLRTIAGTKA
jgi:hypothetical protein